MSCPFDEPKVVHLNMLKKYTGPTIPPQLEEGESDVSADEGQEANILSDSLAHQAADNSDIHVEPWTMPGEGQLQNEPEIIPGEGQNQIDPEVPAGEGQTEQGTRQGDHTDTSRSCGRYNLRGRPKKRVDPAYIYDPVE